MSVSTIRPAAKQCQTELDQTVRALAKLGITTDTSTKATADDITGRLAGTNTGAAARTWTALQAVLWPQGAPEQVGRPDWWTTPLGRLCAHTAATTEDDGISYATAAAMLGVHRGTISQLVARGSLDRHPDQGVSRTSVLHRLARATMAA